MRGNIGCHPDSNPRGTIDQKIREPSRQNSWLLFTAIIVVLKVNRILIDVTQHLNGNLAHSGLGITHGGCPVAINRAKVTMAVNQHIAIAEVLRHPH